jgi:hypothetical protein
VIIAVAHPSEMVDHAAASEEALITSRVPKRKGGNLPSSHLSHQSLTSLNARYVRDGLKRIFAQFFPWVAHPRVDRRPRLFCLVLLWRVHEDPAVRRGYGDADLSSAVLIRLL